jgi:hypothetical protein
MNESHITGWIASAMQFVVAAYALRLNRRFGTARVGWSLCGAFTLLALLQLIQSTTSFSNIVDAALKINVTYALISFLLLLGMVHLETMLKERVRMESLEKQLRAELELEVKSKTAHLNRAIEELMNEMEQTKRMSAIIHSTETAMMIKQAENFAPATLEPAEQKAEGKSIIVHFSPECDDEQALGILQGQLLAHF